VESLMPLRLARYGVPLAETAPSGLAAAGIEPESTTERQIQVGLKPGSAMLPDVAQDQQLPPSPVAHEASVVRTSSSPTRPSTIGQAQRAQHREIDENGLFAQAYRTWLGQFQFDPTPHQFGVFLRDHYAVTTAAGGPLSDDQLDMILASLQQRYSHSGGQVSEERDQEQQTEEGWENHFYRRWVEYAGEYGDYPDADALARYVFERDGITTVAGEPLVGEDVELLVAAFWQREFADTGAQPGSQTLPVVDVVATGPEGPAPAQSVKPTAGEAAAPAEAPQRSSTVPARIDGGEAGEPAPSEAQSVEENLQLTTVDRYYLAWVAYQERHGQEPKDRQLSAYLAEEHGVLGRAGQGISPSTLRRYLPGFRLYTVWSELRARTQRPTAHDVADACVSRGISVRRAPVTEDIVEPEMADFERRWQILSRSGSSPDN
ncbi:hypothetical protein ACH4V2_40500, partial [Streptomyces fructofermentans]